MPSKNHPFNQINPSTMAKSTKTTQAAPDLYALLIGINDYKNHRLEGCENDVGQLRDYLGSSFVKAQFGHIHLRELLNGQATKDNIVQAMKTHLGKAKKNDTVLLYFSGHGAREKTEAAIFRDAEVDSNIGGILCATFESMNQEGLYRHVLSNKELRYLIRPLAMDEANRPKSHVVAIFDCCNSGSNTRSVLGELPGNARQVSRNALPGRTVDQFVFSEDKELVAKLKEQKLGLDEIMPQGDHVMLAACREVELAWEREIGQGRQSGAFTSALVRVLQQHKGHISYHELYSRVLNQMKFSLSTAEGNQGQTPQVYVRTRNLNDRYNIFLTNQPNDQPSYGAVEYSEKDKQWRIDLGAFHGIPADQKTAPTKVRVYPLKKKEEAMEVKIDKAYPFYATLDASAAAGLKKDTAYRGELEGLGISPISVFVKGETKAAGETKKILEAKLEESSGQLFKLAGKELDADYVLIADKGVFSIFRPFDEARPVVKQHSYLDGQDTFNPQAAGDVYAALRQISRWSFLKDLEHTSKELPPGLAGKTTMYPVELRLYRLNPEDGTERRVPSLPNESNKFILEPDAADKKAWLRIELANFAPQILNCSLAIMAGDFSFLVDRDSNLLKAPVSMLHEANDRKNEHIVKSRGGAPARLRGQLAEKYVDLGLDPYYRDFNLQGESTFLKLIVSAKPLDAIETFHMKGLGYPQKENLRSKGFGDYKELEDPQLPEVEWDVRTIEIFLANPDYNPEQA